MGAIITDSCILCFMCVDECVTEAIVYAYSGCEPFMYFQDLVVIQDECVCCGACEFICPVYAIDMNDCGSSGGGGGGTDYGDDGEWDDNSDIEGGGGGGDSSLIDFSNSTDSLIVSTILAAYTSGECILDEIFINFDSVSYTSNPDGTEVEICGQSYNIVVIVSSFSDDLASYPPTCTSSYFTNSYGCWNVVDVGGNAVMTILVDCNDDVSSFVSCLEG